MNFKVIKIKILFIVLLFFLVITPLKNTMAANSDCMWDTSKKCSTLINMHRTETGVSASATLINDGSEEDDDKCGPLGILANQNREYYCCCLGEGAWTQVQDKTFNIDSQVPPPIVKNTKPLNPFDNLQVKIPGLMELSEKYPIICEDENNAETCKIPWIAIYIYAIYNYLLAIGGILAMLSLMIGGVIWLVSAGNANRISQAKSWITGSLTGLVILLTSYVLLYEINPELVGMKYIELKSIDPLDEDAERTDPLNISLASIGVNEDEWITLNHNNIVNNGLRGHKDMVEVVKNAADCMEKLGYKIRVSSFSRSVKDQAKIYNEHYNTPNTCLGEKDRKKDKNIACCPFPAGEKVCPHNTGYAIDIWGWDPDSKCKNNIGKKAQLALQSCMFKEGAYLLNSECWHFEYPPVSTSGRSQNDNLNGPSCSLLANETCP